MGTTNFKEFDIKKEHPDIQFYLNQPSGPYRPAIYEKCDMPKFFEMTKRMVFLSALPPKHIEMLYKYSALIDYIKEMTTWEHFKFKLKLRSEALEDNIEYAFYLDSLLMKHYHGPELPGKQKKKRKNESDGCFGFRSNKKEIQAPLLTDLEKEIE